jgi:hypothetical protein
MYKTIRYVIHCLLLMCTPFTLTLHCSQGGVWGSLSRTGFDCHLNGNTGCALLAYAEAAELGYAVAAGNAAYVLDKHSTALASLWSSDSKVRVILTAIFSSANLYLSQDKSV